MTRGNLLADELRSEEALACFDRVLAKTPDVAFAHWSRGLVNLRLGKLREGFADFEWRNKGAISATQRALQGKEWNAGAAPGRGKLFLYAEQGLGDTIQFVRYARILAEQGHRIILEVQRPLVDLCRSLHPSINVIPAGDALPAFEWHSALPSLPFKCNTSIETIPRVSPYLTADPRLAQHWKVRVADEACDAPLRIGLCWSGNPSHDRDARRSIALSNLLPTFAATGVSLVSLQKEVRVTDARQVEALIDWTQDLTTFSETAALIDTLDVVVTVDTAIAHLAGALGKPVWILLPFCADWRWLLDRSDSPWYPSAKLFRQLEAGNWSDPLRRVSDQLNELLSHSP